MRHSISLDFVVMLIMMMMFPLWLYAFGLALLHVFVK